MPFYNAEKFLYELIQLSENLQDDPICNVLNILTQII